MLRLVFLGLVLFAAPAAIAAGRAPMSEATDPTVRLAFACDGRHLCRQMRSCAEARYFLEECGVYRLDGDGDGVPCESLCGSH
jgi:hypothetical protein